MAVLAPNQINWDQRKGREISNVISNISVTPPNPLLPPAVSPAYVSVKEDLVQL